MKKMFLFMALALSLLFSGQSFSQEYKTAVGVRFGWFNGLTVRHFISGNNALHGILAGRFRGYTLIGLYEFQKSTPTPRLNFFFGFGGHISSYNRYYYYPPKDKGYRDGRVFTAGVDGIAGLEYNFEFPLNISLDLKPYIDFIDGNGDIIDLGLSARYYF